MKGRFTAGYLMWRLRVWRALHPARRRWVPIDLWWKLEPQIRLVLMTNPAWHQLNFRIRDDSQTLNSTTFTYTLGEDPTLDMDTTYRVRFTIEETATANPAVNQGFAAYFQVDAGGYGPLTTSSSGVKSVTSGQFTDGDATTNVLTGSARTFVAGEGDTDGSTGNLVGFANSHTEIEFAFQLDSAVLTGGEVVNIRVELDDGTDLGSYADTPIITVKTPAVALAATHNAAADMDTSVTRVRGLASSANAATSMAAALTVTSASPIAKVSLTNAGTPDVDTDHVLRAEAWLDTGQTGDLKIDLYQGASTQIDTWTISTLTTTPTAFARTIPSGSIANITDYTDLRLFIQGTDMSSKTAVRLGWVQLETPEPAGAATIPVPWKAPVAADMDTTVTRIRGLSASHDAAADLDTTVTRQRGLAASHDAASSMTAALDVVSKVQLAVSMDQAASTSTAVTRKRGLASTADAASSLSADVTSSGKISLAVSMDQAASSTTTLRADMAVATTMPAAASLSTDLTEYEKVQLAVTMPNAASSTTAVGRRRGLSSTANAASDTATALRKDTALATTMPAATDMDVDLETTGSVSLAVTMSQAASMSVAVRQDLALASSANAASDADITVSVGGVQDIAFTAPVAADAPTTLRADLALASTANNAADTDITVTRRRGLASSANVATGQTTTLSVKRTVAATMPNATSASASAGVKMGLSSSAPAASSHTADVSTTGNIALSATMPNAASMSVGLTVRYSLSSTAPAASDLDVTVSTTGFVDLTVTMSVAASSSTSLTVFKRVQLAGVMPTANSCTSTPTRRRGLASVAPASSSITSRMGAIRPLVWSAPTASSASCAIYRRRYLSSVAPVANDLTSWLSLTGFVDLFPDGYDAANSMRITLFVSPAITAIGGTRPYVAVTRNPEPVTRSYSTPEPSTTIEDNETEFAR